MVYDEESGLVYEESVQRRCDCLRNSVQAKRSTPRPQSRRKGAASLSVVSWTRLLQNLNSLEVNSLLGLPPTLLEQIWQRIEKEQLDSLRAWKLFAHCHPTGVLGRYDWHVHCEGRCNSLPQILQLAEGESWLTHLTLGAYNLESTDLSQLSGLRNVRMIDIRGGSRYQPYGLTDRIFRSWADAADHGAFGKLEMLFLDFAGYGSGYIEFTHRSLENLNRFPKLQLFAVHKSRYHRLDTSAANSFLPFVVNRGHFTEYGKSEIDHLSWPQMVNAYVSSRLRHSDRLGLQFLDVKVGTSGEGLRYGTADFVAFERNSTLEPVKRKPDLTEAPRDKGPKMRKLKTWKSLELSTMLDSF